VIFVLENYKLSPVSNILVCIDYITHAEVIRRSQIKSLLVSFVEPPLSPGTLLCSKAAPRTKQTHGGGGGSSIPPHYRELGERLMLLQESCLLYVRRAAVVLISASASANLLQDL
jgi:hypothetical protein